jgi:hypothetical protein
MQMKFSGKEIPFCWYDGFALKRTCVIVFKRIVNP